MPRIAVMPPALASQIAAGEVVERPASAAKELIENAIDARATRCDVEIDGGGITRLAVSDDGIGMTREDALLCLERHATSKLFAIDDLERLGTYGFRGEALPSIASVCRLRLVTRPADADEGICVEVDGGATARVRATGSPVGTRIEIRDLFYNVVARRKFLRSSGTESGHVTDVVATTALAHPEMTFTLARDGRRSREWLRASSREERVRGAIDEPLAACQGTRGPLTVEAYLGRPEHARSGTRGLDLFVNGRPVKDRVLTHTVAQAYGSVLERGRYPRGVVYLDLPGALVDVNVHPQKSEVRFVDGRAVSDALYQVLSVELARAFQLPDPPRSLWAVRREEPRAHGGSRLSVHDVATNAPAAPRAGGRGPLHAALEPQAAGLPPAGHPGEALLAGTAAAPPPQSARGSAGLASPVLTDAESDVLSTEPAAPTMADRAPIAPSGGGTWKALTFVAQVRRTYLLCEGPDGLYVIDQHAAAERVNFDRLRKQYSSRAVPSQALLFPLTMSVRPEETELVEAKGDELLALGLDVRVRGPETVSVHTVPRLLARARPEVLVRDLLTEVQRTGNRAFSDAVDLALATMACHGSIRAGDEISTQEARALLEALDHADFAGHCPHGRPVVSVTTWAELERRVGRR
jgi:DNA mismatch repair protein MutL